MTSEVVRDQRMRVLSMLSCADKLAYAFASLHCGRVAETYPLSGVQIVKGLGSGEGVGRVPRPRPLVFLRRNGFFHRTTVMSTSVIVEMISSVWDHHVRSLGATWLMSGGSTHSMGFLRLSTRASNAHSTFSTSGDRTESTTPLSMSCGP